MTDFVLRVDGEYPIVMEAESIEDAAAFAQADEWPWRRSAYLVEVGNEDNRLDLVVG